jgi:hypothetical protein
MSARKPVRLETTIRPRFVLTFHGLLVYHLWREFPEESVAASERRAAKMIRSDDYFCERERNAWEAAIRDRARFGAGA